MARDRQRAKQRQAERRAARLGADGESPPDGESPRAKANGEAEAAPPEAQRPEPEDLAPRGKGLDPEDASLTSSAPPENIGRSDSLGETPPAPHFEVDEPEERLLEAQESEEVLAEAEEPDEDELDDDELDDDELDEDEADEHGAATPSRRSREGSDGKERGKVMSFLAAVVAELKRVQWPNRQQLTSLTGVVLGFVLIAGGYLGLLDAIVSRIIEQIL